MRAEHPNIVLMDLRAPIEPALTAVRAIAGPAGESLLSEATVVVLAGEPCASETGLDVVFRALEAGAVGYLLKNRDADLLLDAIRATARGQGFISPHLTIPVIREMIRRRDERARARAAAFSVLSATELDVVSQLCRGVTTTRDIAAVLSLTPGKVRAHIASAERRIGLNDETQLLLWGLRLGLDRDRPPDE